MCCKTMPSGVIHSSSYCDKFSGYCDKFSRKAVENSCRRGATYRCGEGMVTNFARSSLGGRRFVAARGAKDTSARGLQRGAAWGIEIGLRPEPALILRLMALPPMYRLQAYRG